MSDRLIFITKDNQEVVVSKSLFYEMSGMIRSLFECEDNEKEDIKLHLPSITKQVLNTVIEFMELKKKTNGEISISDIHIDESVILDVMAAAAFFDC